MQRIVCEQTGLRSAVREEKGGYMRETVSDIQNRRSVKEYKAEQITDEELTAVLEAGMNAPSGGNRQSPVFIAVQNKEWIQKLCRLNAEIAGAPEGFDVFYGAPTIILVLADKNAPDTGRKPVPGKYVQRGIRAWPGFPLDQPDSGNI